MKLEAVFIDRDGTIGGTGKVVYPKDFQLYPFTLDSIKILKEEKLHVFAFSNQPGISKGLALEDEFRQQLNLYGFEDAYICPHDDSFGCNCRKPNTGLLIKASNDYNLDLSKCAVIGDSWRDMLAAHKANAVKILVKTGDGNNTLRKLKEEYPQVKVDYIAENLLDGVKWILKTF